MLKKDHKINERWKSYFKKLFNANNGDIRGQLEDTKSIKKYNYCHKVSIMEVKETLRKMRLRKAIGPQGIPSEVWKCLLIKESNGYTIYSIIY